MISLVRRQRHDDDRPTAAEECEEAMSNLRSGDDDMHYENGSHRWVPPIGRADQAAWEDRVREHQRQHQRQLSASNAPPPQAERQRPRIPRQRLPQPARQRMR
ncbi:hypothetical protein [Micromonospora sp. NPDC049679]|uniref:hypothetical protein n=1 Tax=Micromonospora sp. NPDC049679 TaxID=3155920 RepID=UPI0033CF8612